MKKLFLWLMAILLIIGSTNEANARSKKKKGKAKTEQQTDSVQKKKCLKLKMSPKHLLKIR